MWNFNKTFCVYLLGSVLKFVFQWDAQLLSLIKYSFCSFAEGTISWEPEKWDVPSTYNLTIEVTPSGKSFIWIKNDKGLKGIHVALFALE